MVWVLIGILSEGSFELTNLVFSPLGHIMDFDTELSNPFHYNMGYMFPLNFGTTARDLCRKDSIPRGSYIEYRSI